MQYKHTNNDAEDYSTLCTVTADTPQMIKTLTPKVGLNGVRYYSQDFNVVLLFGLTELKAQIAWMEDVGRPLVLSVWFADSRSIIGYGEKVGNHWC
jgi:hypothetical protein